MDSFTLEIFTPYRHYLTAEVEYLMVQSEDYTLGILPHHAPLVSSLKISEMIIQNHGERFFYAIGGGIIKVSKEKVSVLVNSIERSDEIDLDRALEAKKRALERLNSKDKKSIDKNRAKLALARALNRIRLLEKNS